MGRTIKKRLPDAAVGLTALLLFNWAVAAPPQGRQQFRTPPPAFGSSQHLDLRPPSHLEIPGNSTEKSHAFARLPASRQSSGPGEREALPAMASDGMRSRPAIQDFVRRVHHEGLPVARLFETKSALLHLGLSPKGKPGLWLVQKTH